MTVTRYNVADHVLNVGVYYSFVCLYGVYCLHTGIYSASWRVKNENIFLQVVECPPAFIMLEPWVNSNTTNTFKKHILHGHVSKLESETVVVYMVF